jgi:hypothetical protein
MAEALNLRERGYTYEQISRHMKRPMMTVHRWVSDAIDEIVQEPAARVLKLELQRLDAYLVAITRTLWTAIYPPPRWRCGLSRSGRSCSGSTPNKVSNRPSP